MALRYLISLCLILTACSPFPSNSEGTTTVFSGNAMTIDYRILVAGNLSAADVGRVETIINAVFEEIDRTYNKWNPDSELSHLNQLKAHTIIPISSKLETFLEQTNEIVVLTQGRFDPTIEPIQQLWKKKLEQGSAPTQQEINAIMSAVGWDKVHFEKGQFYKDNDLTSLDLGGIAKGLCVDCLIDRLAAAGFPDIFVEWGGEIRTQGKHPAKRPWGVFISNLGDQNPENAIAQLELSNQAIATSGDYLQNWTVDEGSDRITYFHVLNPKTGRMLVSTENSIASASIVAPNCAWADGLATAAMVFQSKQAALEWLDSVKAHHPSLQYWIVSRQ